MCTAFDINSGRFESVLECPGVSLADKASFELESARAFEYKYSLLLQSKDIQHAIGIL